MGSLKVRQFQSDHQESLKLSWMLGSISLVPTLRQEMPQSALTQGTLWVTLVGILTSYADKRGKLCRGNGCWLLGGGKVRWARRHLSASSVHPRNSGNVPGQEEILKGWEPAQVSPWQEKGKQHSFYHPTIFIVALVHSLCILSFLLAVWFVSLNILYWEEWGVGG